MLSSALRNRSQRGVSMLEVLVTLFITAFGVLGLAGLQSKMQAAEMESYQRAQAVVLMSDMVERIKAGSYIDPTTQALNVDYSVNVGTATPLGTGNGSQPSSCTGAAVGVALDQCEWHYELLGAAESKGGNRIGAMTGARGCIELVQTPLVDPNPAAPTCQGAVYRVTVTWQGFDSTVAPSLTCGAGQYSPAATQRTISTQVAIPLQQC